MSFRAYLLILLLALPGFSKAQLGFTITEGHQAQFPIEICNNLVIIPIVLNGQLPLKFILDTGVRTTILTEKTFSDILNLQYGRHYMVAGPGGEKLVEAYVTNNVTIDMPGVHGEGHAMLVLEKDYLELRNYLGTDVQGILGYELFSRFVVAIDYEAKLLTIAHPQYYKVRKKFQAIPITIQDTKPYIHVPIELGFGNEVDAKLMVDTGASHGLVLDPTTDKRISLPTKHVSSLIGRGIGGLITGEIGRVQSVHLGRYNVRDVIANFPDPNSYVDTLRSTDVFRNGAIGGEMLSRFTAVFDYSHEKIYLKKNATYASKFHFNMSGLTLKAKGSRLRKFEITDVRRNSAGEKVDIHNGDEVLSINGLPVSSLDLNTINSYFNSKPGKKIRIEVLRNGLKITKTLQLDSQI